MLHAETADVMLAEDEVANYSASTRIFLGTDAVEAFGTLMITSRCEAYPLRPALSHELVCLRRRVVWLPSNGQQRVQGFSLFFQAIAMHAISRDTSDFSHPCLYVQLDPDQNISEVSDALRQRGNANKRQRHEGGAAADDADEEDEEDLDYQEMRLVAMDGSDAALDAMYKAMTEGAELNPDPDEDDGEEGGFFADDDELLAGVSSHQLSMLERYEGMLNAGEAPPDTDGRFDDAEEDDAAADEAKETGEGQ